VAHRPRGRLLRRLLGPQKRLEQILVEDATSEVVTIPHPHTAVVPKNMSYGIGFVVAISTVIPNVYALDRLVTALAVALHPHLGSDTNR
jgi:hypothetical protein